MDLMNERLAAAYLNCSASKLQKDRKKNSPIPFYRVGRHIKYAQCDLDEYLNNNRFTSTSEYGGEDA
ncbi:MAG: DNA-binding protein [Alphaproteobacteria bacterium]|nr:DNA-binding protein [Alphaproteobacteria bacterium]|tara:strand:- start:5108 stop:5308 length:201 start_codon:yes stop_codon:yes gene_type:complete